MTDENGLWSQDFEKSTLYIRQGCCDGFKLGFRDARVSLKFVSLRAIWIMKEILTELDSQLSGFRVLQARP